MTETRPCNRYAYAAGMLHVECKHSPSGDLEPQVICFGSRRVDVQEVTDQWHGSHQRWWKVRTSEGQYIVRLDAGLGVWELAAVVGE